MIYAELSMPNVGSWNGHWSREKETHIKQLDSRYKKLVNRSFFYDFGDGWTALVSIKEINGNSDEWRKMKKANTGFCGYDWMLRSILTYGEIRKTA